MTDAKKPWEEEWRLGVSKEGHGDIVVGDTDDEWCFFDHDSTYDPDYDARTRSAIQNEARARLAACSPEAIRLLLEAEWVDQEYEVDDGGGYTDTMTRAVCVFCHNEQHRDHKPDCRWVALMRKAGVRE